MSGRTTTRTTQNSRRAGLTAPLAGPSRSRKGKAPEHHSTTPSLLDLDNEDEPQPNPDPDDDPDDNGDDDDEGNEPDDEQDDSGDPEDAPTLATAIALLAQTLKQPRESPASLSKV